MSTDHNQFSSLSAVIGGSIVGGACQVLATDGVMAAGNGNALSAFLWTELAFGTLALAGSKCPRQPSENCRIRSRFFDGVFQSGCVQTIATSSAMIFGAPNRLGTVIAVDALFSVAMFALAARVGIDFIRNAQRRNANELGPKSRPPENCL